MIANVIEPIMCKWFHLRLEYTVSCSIPPITICQDDDIDVIIKEYCVILGLITNDMISSSKKTDSISRIMTRSP